MQTTYRSARSAEWAGRHLAVIGAASSIGIRPYDDERMARRLDRAPAALRELGLLEILGAEDFRDVHPPSYRDFTRRPGTVRNEHGVASYSRALAERVALALEHGRFPLVIGGDCSIILGTLLAARRFASRVGLAYLDAHADFGTPEESRTGSAASMCLALAAGRGVSPLAALTGSEPLVRGEDVALIGRRDEGQSYYGHDALAAAGILDLPGTVLAGEGSAIVATRALERIAGDRIDGFWIHVDADVLDPRIMPAVDSPEPGGPDVAQLAALVGPLAAHPKAIGMQLTIYDPSLDPDLTAAAHLLELLERALAPMAWEAAS